MEETEHYTIYYPEGEQISASYVGGVLEDHLGKVIQDLGYQPQEKIKVIIFSDLDTFHHTIELPNAPEWVIAAGYEGGIQMVTPRLISTDMLEPAIIHELTHAIQGQINPGAPFWMIEGIAMYEAGMSQGVRETIGKRVQKADLPALDSLETLDEEDFAQADGYALGYTVVEYAVQAYGHTILAEWVKTPRDYKRVFGVPKERFEEQWMSWLAETYRS